MNNSHFDDMLRDRLEAAADVPSRADWPDVLARVAASRPTAAAARPALLRRRPLIVAFAATAAMLAAAAAPALGLSDRLISLFADSPRAPEPTQREFATLDAGAPAGMESQVLAGTARKALEQAIPEGTAVLWVAPSANGGFCKMLELVSDTAVARGGPGCDFRANATGIGLVVPGPIVNGTISQGPVAIYGHATDPQATDAVVRYPDGTSTVVPLTRITEPIDAGFFILSVPRAKWKTDDFQLEVRFIDADGRTVDSARQIGLPVAP